MSPVISALYLGPYWTHVLFTWTQAEGLKVYINGTFNVGDPTGRVAQNYGDQYADLVIGTGNFGTYKQYAKGAFDEFVIWERALSPQDIWMYYKAAIGKLLQSSSSFCLSIGLFLSHHLWQLQYVFSAVAIVGVSQISCTWCLVHLTCPSLSLSRW